MLGCRYNKSMAKSARYTPGACRVRSGCQVSGNRDLAQSVSQLRNPDRHPRIHLRLPQDRAARLRHLVDPLHAQQRLPGVEVAERVSDVLSQYRDLPGEHCQPCAVKTWCAPLDQMGRSEGRIPAARRHWDGCDRALSQTEKVRPRYAGWTAISFRWRTAEMPADLYSASFSQLTKYLRTPMALYCPQGPFGPR